MNHFSVYDIEDVYSLRENQKHEEALKLLLEMYTYSKKILNFESPYLCHEIAHSHATLGSYFRAIDWETKAKVSDPFNYDYKAFYLKLLGEIELSINDLIPLGIEKKEEIEKTYNYLHQHGYVRSSLQFKMIRYYSKIHDTSTARKLLDNFLERNPNDEEALFLDSILRNLYSKAC